MKNTGPARSCSVFLSLSLSPSQPSPQDNFPIDYYREWKGGRERNGRKGKGEGKEGGGEGRKRQIYAFIG